MTMTPRNSSTATRSSAPWLKAVHVVLTIIALIICPSRAFVTFQSFSCPSKTHHEKCFPTNTISFQSTTTALHSTKSPTSNIIDPTSQLYTETSKIKRQLNTAITTQQPHTQILTHLTQLESLSPLTTPARHPSMDGPWIVLYTDAPPPSNGRLGIFQGVAKQVIDLHGGTYTNELYVGGKGVDGDVGAWLSAVLVATWSEWDGVYLDQVDNNDTNNSSVEKSQGDNVDYGATTWKVDFQSLTLKLFNVPIFTQQFAEGTARTWKMTYLDDETRIVRAGKTGRGEDDWIFYMRRGTV